MCEIACSNSYFIIHNKRMQIGFPIFFYFIFLQRINNNNVIIIIMVIKWNKIQKKEKNFNKLEFMQKKNKKKAI